VRPNTLLPEVTGEQATLHIRTMVITEEIIPRYGDMRMKLARYFSCANIEYIIVLLRLIVNTPQNPLGFLHSVSRLCADASVVSCNGYVVNLTKT
jgi:hypothetical protein